MKRRDTYTDLVALRDSLRQRVDADLVNEAPVSDFDAMMSRVRALDSTVAARYETLQADTGQIEATGEPRGGGKDGPGVDGPGVDGPGVDGPGDGANREALAPRAMNLRNVLDRRIEARKNEGPWRGATVPVRTHLVWGAAAAVVAAAVVLAVFNLDLFRSGETFDRGYAAMQASDAAQLAKWGGGATVPVPPMGSPAPSSAAGMSDGSDGRTLVVLEPDLAVLSVGVDPVAAGTGSPAPGQQVTPWQPGRETSVEKGRGPSDGTLEARPQDLDRRLRQLDLRAQAQWRDGRHRAAERTLWKVVRIGGRHDRVEMAFAELFALVRQRDGDLARVWRRYLQRFPRGQYAGDAKAGLCRRASGERRQGCWQDYRRSFPRGIHAPPVLP